VVNALCYGGSCFRPKLRRLKRQGEENRAELKKSHHVLCADSFGKTNF
jgi:hypothetical protein